MPVEAWHEATLLSVTSSLTRWIIFDNQHATATTKERHLGQSLAPLEVSHTRGCRGCTVHHRFPRVSFLSKRPLWQCQPSQFCFSTYTDQHAAARTPFAQLKGPPTLTCRMCLFLREDSELRTEWKNVQLGNLFVELFGNRYTSFLLASVSCHFLNTSSCASTWFVNEHAP